MQKTWKISNSNLCTFNYEFLFSMSFRCVCVDCGHSREEIKMNLENGKKRTPQRRRSASVICDCGRQESISRLICQSWQCVCVCSVLCTKRTLPTETWMLSHLISLLISREQKPQHTLQPELLDTHKLLFIQLSDRLALSIRPFDLINELMWNIKKRRTTDKTHRRRRQRQRYGNEPSFEWDEIE